MYAAAAAAKPKVAVVEAPVKKAVPPKAAERKAEPVAVGRVDAKDKVRDLVQWTISDEYFGLREQLGLTIA